MTTAESSSQGRTSSISEGAYTKYIVDALSDGARPEYEPVQAGQFAPLLDILIGDYNPDDLVRFNASLDALKKRHTAFKDVLDGTAGFNGKSDPDYTTSSSGPREKPNTYPIDTSSIDEAIEKEDLKAIWSKEIITILAQLPDHECGFYEARIRAAFKTLNVRRFQSAITTARRELTSGSPSDEEGLTYTIADGHMSYLTQKGDLIGISNFTAQITADITTDDGAEQKRYYGIEATTSNRYFSFEMLARDFAKCDWVDEKLGSRASITTGKSMQSHLINAIKACSTPEDQFHYAHTGWREVDGEMIYLHNDGFVSQVSQGHHDHLTHNFYSKESASRGDGERENKRKSQVSQVSQENNTIRVKLSGPLAKYALSLAVEHDAAQEAIRRSLRILDITEDIITMPLYSSLWRSILPDVHYGVHVAGQSGKGKSELVALIQQHFGAELDANKLPGSWMSTDNSLEMLLFQAKDTVVVIDDFKPVGSKTDQERLHAKADRIFRSIGNGTARGRLQGGPELEQRAERRPRCMLISTGEDVPRGQSLTARCVSLTMSQPITEGKASKRLGAAQIDARQGVYVQAMTAYIAWLAPQMKQIRSQLPTQITAVRDQLLTVLGTDGHARLGTNTANMLVGFKYFLQFAVESGAISPKEAKAYDARCTTALRQIADEATGENNQRKPTEQWRRLIVTALASKKAHLVTADGDNPGSAYGWVKSVRESEETHHGGGDQIGWIDGDDIYLSSMAAYKVARMMGSSTGDEMTTLEPTLRKFLVQENLLASTDLHKSRKTITIRRRLEKVQRDVLHFQANIFFPDNDPIDSKFHDSPDSEPHRSASEETSGYSQTSDSEPDHMTQNPQNSQNADSPDRMTDDDSEETVF